MAKKDSKQYIKSVSAFNGGGSFKPNNTPTQYKDRQTQYMAGRTATFDAYRAYLSTDYVNAEVQGVMDGDFYKWVNTNIRLADITSSSASSTKRVDDYKQVLLPELGIDYFPIGAKIKTMGSTWLCINPSNISSVKTKAVVARCNASYNSYDYYGNVITEPILVEKYSMLGNDNEQKSSIVLMDGYFNVTCQLNENTAKLQENSRIILGKKPYHITGLTDFIQEFAEDYNDIHNKQTLFTKLRVDIKNGELNATYPKEYNGETFSIKNNNLIVKSSNTHELNDYQLENGQLRMLLLKNKKNTIHLLNFTIRVEEPTESDDITENFIANGKEYEFDCILQGVDNIGVGETVEFIPHFIKNNEVVENTEEHPITWEWESADSEIATVDENGMVTALASGYTQITARMVQNPSITAIAELVVVKTKTGKNRVVFTSVVPNELSQYDSVIITATYKENGLASYKPLEWSFNGANKEDYTAVVSQDGASVEITCISPSDNNLTVTANYNGVSATVKIALVGY